MDLSDLRSDYNIQELRREDLLIDPLEQFRAWLKVAGMHKFLNPTPWY